MNTNQKSKWWVDAVLFSLFIATFFLDLTGIDLHQWIGVICGLMAGYHLVTHWEWVKAVTGRFFGNTSDRARSYYLLDALILTGLFLIVGTGLVISTWLNLSLASYATWHAVHVGASIFTLLALVVKLVLHWRWIAATAGKLFSRPAVQSGRVPGAVALSRREFLKFAGVVGVTSFLALGNSLDGLSAASASSTAETQTSNPLQSVTISQPTSVASSASSGTCQLRCGRRCSYPGQCRRYTDSNGNGRCDLGECL